ncbi:nucleotidyltransferase [Foetidibacter luteolus]|uniref:nucleotidyltransferase n=1 Tax=Foetidibacter luteolus TaxID=2608880 RepID=UPI00129B0BB8|nr:nucleotidyltransferase [Foetidibacter luteolus]
MDVFDEEILLFWKYLQQSQVRYIMVGGYATNLHGYQRYTKDMDLWIEDTIENRENLRTAFRDYGMGDFFMMTTLQIVPGWTHFNLNNGMQLDLMTGMKGLEGFTFEECLMQAEVADIDGIRIPFLHINHLIANKKSVNRPKDQLDVIYLEKIKQLREEGFSNP